MWHVPCFGLVLMASWADRFCVQLPACELGSLASLGACSGAGNHGSEPRGSGHTQFMSDRLGSRCRLPVNAAGFAANELAPELAGKAANVAAKEPAPSRSTGTLWDSAVAEVVDFRH